MNIAQSLLKAGYEKCDWGPTYQTYDELKDGWRDKETPCPSKEELEAAWVKVQADLATQKTKDALAASDAKISRMAEDVFVALKVKGVLDDTDLPEALKIKLQERENLRDDL